MRGLKLLLWKNYKILSREKVSLAVSITLPLVCISLSAALRCAVKTVEHPDSTIYEAFNAKEIPEVVRNQTNTIYYAPSNPMTDSIMQFVLDNSFTAQGLNYNFVAFGRAGDLINTYEEEYKNRYVDSTEEILAGVIFTNMGVKRFPEEIKYTLKFPGSQRTSYNPLRDRGNANPCWFTETPWARSAFGGLRSKDSKYGGFPGYFDEGYLYLQYAINKAILNTVLNSTQVADLDQFNLLLQRFPAPSFTEDDFFFILQLLVPIVATAAFTYNVLELTKQIIHERTSRLKEFMKIMGLCNWQHLLCWFMRSYVLLLIVAALMVLILKLELKDTTSVLTHSDPLVIFVLLSVHILNVVTYSFLFAALFDNENSGSTIAAFTWVLSGYHSYAFIYEYFKMKTWEKILACFLAPNTPMFLVLNFMHRFESFGEGLQWNNFWHGMTPTDDFSVGICIAMSTLNSVIYFLTAAYIELAFPGKYGIGLPWYFPFTIWFWTGKSRKPKMVYANKQKDDSDAFEEEPQHLEASVVIRNLTKVFGSKVAVKNLTFNLYHNQVTSLLGPNGAGKTTTMSILTGLIRPTSGVVRVNSYDISTEISRIRTSLGFCPQYNILFNNLTVEEHLKFYCQIKGLNEAETLNETERWINTLGLEDKRKTQSKYLSSGMKRKLCVGIALSAGSKVIILDEPTAGVDPEARRSIWDLIQAEKRGRTVLLSTHYMEEADILGDRIAIMADGKLLCSGSSMFLKSKFGDFYNLVIVKSEGSSSEAIKDTILEVVPSVQFGLDTRTEIHCTLPAKEVDLFPRIFEELETCKNELGIRTYGIGSIPLQEIFFRVTNNSPRNTHLKFGVESLEKMLSTSTASIHNLENASSRSISELYHHNIERNQGFRLLWQQFIAMVKKKLRISFRSRTIMLLQVAIPVFGLIGAYKISTFCPGIETPIEDINSLESTREKMGLCTAIFNCLPDSHVCHAFKSILQGYHNINDIEDTSVVTALLDMLSEIRYRDGSKYLLAFEEVFNQTENRKQLTVLFNNEPYHIPPVALNLMFNGLLKLFGLNFTITTSNHPFDHTPIDDLVSTSFINLNFMLGVCASATLTFFAGAFVILPLSERVSNFKHLQVIAGAKLPLYWLADLLVNMGFVAFGYIGIIITTVIYDVDAFSSWEVRGGVFISVFMFGLVTILLCMLISTLMNDPTLAYARILAVNVLGLAVSISYGVINSPDLGIQDTVNTLHDIFLFVPSYGVGMAIYFLARNRQLKINCIYINTAQLCLNEPNDECCSPDKGYYAWDEPGIGKYLVRMSGLGAVFLILLIIMETGIISKITRLLFWNKSKSFKLDSDALELSDTDVLSESHRINHCTLATLNYTDNLIVKGLTKTYKGKHSAVNNLNFGLKKGEVFGLLGINGAGKTSTFKMLTGNASITSGDAYINYCSVKLDLAKACSYLGYCPQFDACNDELTGRETLTFFAQLKGIPEEKIDGLVKRTSESLLFRHFLDKRFGSLSCGCKRKLSTAIAMLGDPSVILLDEPTAGMDPVSTRHVWNAVSKVRDTGTSILLTSHNMEECEALCTTLAIMVQGQLKCLGSPQHLKSKLLSSYKLIIQLPSFPLQDEQRDNRADLDALMQAVKDFLKLRFPGCVLTDSHWGFLEFLIPTNSATWGEVFTTMQEAKDIFDLEGYNVGQVDLEQVFFKFVHE